MPTGVFVRTKEYRDNMAITMKGNSNGFKKGHKSLWNGKRNTNIIQLTEYLEKS